MGAARGLGSRNWPKEDTVSDQLKAEELSGCMLKLVVLSPGSIAASVGNRGLELKLVFVCCEASGLRSGL